MVRTFIAIILNIYNTGSVENIVRALLKRAGGDNSIGSTDLLTDFLFNKYKPKKNEIEQFIHLTSTLICSTTKKRVVIVIDDLHHISLPAIEVLELILKIFKQNVSFIISYRENEINHVIREKLFRLSTEIIKLGPLLEKDLIACLNIIARLPENIIKDLITLSQGNPYCLIESLRLLEKTDKITFDTDGYIIEAYPGACIDFEWPNQYLNDLKKYAHQLSIKRYQLILNQNEESRSLIEKLAMYLAAAGQSLPLSLMKAAFGSHILPLLDELIDEQLLNVRTGDFVQELSIYLIHDRMAESLTIEGSKKRLFWAEINSQLAHAFVNFLDPLLIPQFYLKIAEHYHIAGNVDQELEFLIKHFWRAVDLQYNSEIVSIGLRYISLIESRQNRDYSLMSSMLLRMGISEHMQRNFEEMEKCFKKCEIVSPININNQIILKVYRCTANMISQPYDSDYSYSELQVAIKHLESIFNKNDQEIEALIHAYNQSFLHYKKRADYETALNINQIAIDISKKTGKLGMLLWEEINRGTLILFQDEKYRNRLEFNAMPAIWQKTLDYWNEILFKAEDLKIIEHLVETNCAVGFMKMYLGFHNNNVQYCEESLLHLRRARYFAEKYDHPYWLCKLHNHFGIYYSLSNELEKAVDELKKGIVVAKKLNNYFTIWMLYQNLSNIAKSMNMLLPLIDYWKDGFRYAMNNYFKNESSAILNYNFRIFIRGFLLHANEFQELTYLSKEYMVLFDLIAQDCGFQKFREYLDHKKSIPLEKKDMYVFGRSYYNTH